MIELLQFIKDCIKKDILNISDINFDILLSQNEEVLNGIMKTSANKRIPLIYLYSSKGFTDEKNEYKNEIISFFSDNDLNDFQTKYGCLVAGNKDALELPLERLIELISIVISGEEEYQAKYASILGTIRKVIFSPNSFDIIKSITKSSGEVQAINACEIAIRVLERPDVKDIINQVAMANYGYQAREACFATICKKVVEMPNLLEIIKSIVKSSGENQANYAALAIMLEKVYIRPDAAKLVDLIAKAKGEIQAKCGYEALQNDEIIALENLIPSISLLTNAKEAFQSSDGLTALQKLAPLTETPEKLMLPVTRAKGECQSFYGALAITKETMEIPNIDKIIEAITESYGDIQSKCGYELTNNHLFMIREDAYKIIDFITSLKEKSQVETMYKILIDGTLKQKNALEILHNMQIMMNVKETQVSPLSLYESKFTDEYKFFDFVDALNNNPVEEEEIKQLIIQKEK